MTNKEKPPYALQANGGEVKTNFAGGQRVSVSECSTNLEKKTIGSCHECGKPEHAGYRWRLVPICDGCRTSREVDITRNRFTRREKARYS